ncbi:DNA polymerase III subunit delta' [Virgibacillus soli]|uniref:DNA polymerase III subunit delta' n=1 Tax=Paracerasibacillus soli TaxID=480284 RepID=UPI0035EF342C
MNTWEELGEEQPLVSKILMNSFNRNRVSHAYLFQGARGTGKEATALLLAKVLFCQNKQELNPCQHCVMCKRIESKNHPDVHWIEPDGQSIKIEQIRHLQKEFSYSGLESNQKVYIIKDADTLTVNAANRILKFLEEPSQQTTAIMLTENSHAIISTIRSRCQVIDFQPLNPQQFQNQLVEKGMSKSNAILMSAITNDVEEAFHLCNDEWFVQARKYVVQLIEILIKNKDDAYLFIHQHWLKHFKERKQQEQGLDLLLLAFRDILFTHLENEKALVFFSVEDERLDQALIYFPQEKLVKILEDIMHAKRMLKQNVQPTLVMEQLTLQI